MVFTIRATIEVLGYPQEHVEEVLKKIIEKLKTETGVQVTKADINETKKVKEKFFAAFVEVEAKMHDFSNLLNFCYDYLPSSLEILDTEKVTVSAREFNFGLNEMLAKLHHYNLIVNNLTERLKKLTPPKKE